VFHEGLADIPSTARVCEEADHAGRPGLVTFFKMSFADVYEARDIVIHGHENCFRGQAFPLCVRAISPTERLRELLRLHGKAVWDLSSNVVVDGCQRSEMVREELSDLHNEASKYSG
jgi:hypothetical protein